MSCTFSLRQNVLAASLFLSALLLFSLLSAPHAGAPKQPRVAVFFEPGFPYYNQAALVSPKEIAEDLQKAGVGADLLDAATLSDPAKLNATAYAAVILPYGNAYPETAFANLRVFHAAGGDLVTSGIPFTHAIRKDDKGVWQDEGNNDDAGRFGPNGIGVGGFRSGANGHASVAAGDPLGLAPLSLDWGNGHDTQALDPASFPATDTIDSILTAGGQPLAALVIHGPAMHGAIDVWTANSLRSDDALVAFASVQLMVRGTVAALARQGLLNNAGRTRAFAALDTLPKPVVDANLILPTPPRPYPTLQPKMPPPSRHLMVADVRKMPADQLLLLASLQGIVNRRQPRIYLITADSDQFWLTQMQAQGETDTPIPVADPLTLVQMFRSEIKGVVVSDSNVYVSPCIAVDIAGLDNLVIATPALAQRLDLPIKNDLRGKFKDDADALRFARTELLPHSDTYLALCIDPAILGAQVDDIIAARGTCFWITGPKAQNQPGADMGAERAEIARTFARMPLTAVIRGFWWRCDGMGLDETPGVAFGSRYGKITTVSDYVSNFSVTSGGRLGSLKQKPQPPAPPLDPSKVYIALTISDGDNLCTWRDVFRQFMTDPLFGTFPVAIGMGPSLIDVAPVEAQWYYDHASPTTEFLCDVSGAGYIYPTEWGKTLKDRNAALTTFYGWTDSYMARMDMHTMRSMNVNTDDITTAGRLLPKVSFLMPDYGLAGESAYSQFTYTLPTGQAVFRGASDGPGAAKLADEIRTNAGTTRPAFLNSFVYIWGTHLSDLKQMLTLLGPDYVAVTPTQLNALYRQSMHK
ncbi:MAG: GxGYxYP domain-containing protein [Janthinobacterium lividum]